MQETTQSQAAVRIAETISIFAGNKTLVFVSGGSSAKIAALALSKIDTSNITVMLADERYVPYNSPDSNATLLKKLGVRKYCDNFIEVLSPQNQKIDIVTDCFRQNIAEQLKAAQTIIAVLGIGTDNHTAGIMPNTVSVHTDDPLAINYKNTDYERITIAPAIFEKINYAFVYAEGEEKRPAIEAIENDLNYVEYPSQLIKRCHRWYVMFNKEKL